MSSLVSEWQSKKAREAEALYDRLRTAIQHGEVRLVVDHASLDYRGSPVHQPWDHLAPLLALMFLALVILLAWGVAIGIVAMTLGALLHLTANRRFVAWRLKKRVQSQLLDTLARWSALWQMGGIALLLSGTDEPPCVAPAGDWRKFVVRNLNPNSIPAAPDAQAETGEADNGG